ncbi:MAG: glycosyl hydrolase, partial [Actinobacteria bacterium]|nr:glycosyl hydrolase [Actinomycetota bacterium]
WNTRCAAGPCDWKRIRDTGGPGASTTAIAVNRDTIYAAWCFPGSGCNPGQGFEFDSGIDTNYGGRWHTVNAPNLPNRYINQVTVDPKDPAHVYAVYGAFSRRWIPGAGVGHVFESSNGGRTWRDISGNLPDIPADDLLLWKDKLVLATDSNVYIAERNDPSAWTRFGRRLPKSATWDLTPSPDGSYIVAATHGRGLWSINFPK